MSDHRVVALLGAGVVPADTPILRADDLGVIRGDGIFETLHVRGGQPFLLDEHLARMTGSAARLQLDLPPTAELAELAAQACAAWPAGEEGALRIVCTRGPESGGPLTIFATVGPVGAVTRAARRDGVRVITATLGVPAEVRPAAPWLLGGAKTLSYAVNMASLRWAAGQDADDLLWLSADGYVLEAPTSTLIWLTGDELCTVPPQRTGILPGTTAQHVLDRAGELGWRTDLRMVRPDELAGADGTWLTSSVRGVTEIRAIDGTERPAAAATGQLQKLLGYPVP